MFLWADNTVTVVETPQQSLLRRFLSFRFKCKLLNVSFDHAAGTLITRKVAFEGIFT